ncbi:MAG: 16S rRNA (cytosine(1402)-N(4))-methyltransferase RsmH [Actinobacteria bacterium]|nr:16S rRNA (cytosine(1402)-N(4))-methyltransferase RsmH [Actinomycetota bacterium]
MNYENIHKPVLVKEVINYLNLKKGDVIFDGTLGGAGHTIEIIKAIAPTGKIIGVDLDSQAISTAARILAEKKLLDSAYLINDNFVNITGILKKLKIKKVNGFLFDLGISSMQIEGSGKGFSYIRDEKLDMRFGNNTEIDAYSIINEYSEEKLKEIFYKFGEEKWSGRIARSIINHRKVKSIETTGQLSEIISKAIPGRPSNQRRGHPAKRIFQALRIEVNDELDNIGKSLDQSINFLEKKGRIAVISYHSLEDRIVKKKFENFSGKCVCPPDFPICRCEARKRGNILTKKVVRPAAKEIEDNPRSKSAKLRVFEKV